MKLLGIERLRDFEDAYPDAKEQVRSWEREVKKAQWKTPHDLKNMYPRASLIGNQQVVFDIRGNKYRLWVEVAYRTAIVLIKKAGTHREYDKWDIE